MNKQIPTGILTRLRDQRPLVQAITNYVTINDCANILLSLGAAPAMCEARNEVEEFAAAADALYLNTGTLTAEQKDAMMIAAAAAEQTSTPVILDPVGVGGIKQKIDFVNLLLKQHKMAIIKGNAGEIKCLAGFAGEVRGVDSADDGSGLVEACSILAEKYHTVVVATGVADTISDGRRVVQINNGHAALSMVSGTGCMLGAMAAAMAAVEEDFFLAACTSVLAMDIAGELAAQEMGEKILPGTFRVKLIDHIYQLTEGDILKAGDVKWL